MSKCIVVRTQTIAYDHSSLKSYTYTITKIVVKCIVSGNTASSKGNSINSIKRALALLIIIWDMIKSKNMLLLCKNLNMIITTSDEFKSYKLL
jgi:hypothetical protein